MANKTDFMLLPAEAAVLAWLRSRPSEGVVVGLRFPRGGPVLARLADRGFVVSDGETWYMTDAGGAALRANSIVTWFDDCVGVDKCSFDEMEDETDG